MNNHQHHHSAGAAQTPPTMPTTEYDRQFQADLERATALSMETLALDQFKRNKLQYSRSDVTGSSPSAQAAAAAATSSSGYIAKQQHQQQQQQHKSNATAPYIAATRRPRPDSANANPYASTAGISTKSNKSTSFYALQGSASSGSIAPPPNVPPRRASEHRDYRGRSTPPEASADLISFSQPSPPAPIDAFDATASTPSSSQANKPAANDAHSQFLQMVSDMHKLNTQLQQIPPAYRYAIGGSVGAPAAAFVPSSAIHHQPGLSTSTSSSTISASANSTTQMVPYQPPASDQPIPLNPEQLNKLYSMNYTPPQAQVPIGFMRSQSAAQYATTPTYHQQQQHHQHHTPGNYAPAFNYATTSAAAAVAAPVAAGTVIAPTPIQTPNLTNNAAPILGISSVAVSSAVVQPQPPLLPPKHASIGWDIGPALAAVPTTPTTTPAPATSTPIGASSVSTPTTSSHIMRRRPSRPSISTPQSVGNIPSNDLIDLENGIEANSRVSVLEAFDPLLSGNTNIYAATSNAGADSSSTYYDADRADAASDCATSYYSEYDPFDYLYNSGTQYSDPVYDAVVRADTTSGTPSVHGSAGRPPAIGWNVAEADTASLYAEAISPERYQSQPPPLPPRSSTTTKSPAVDQQQQYQQAAAIKAEVYTSQMQTHQRWIGSGDRKLYHNVVERKTFEPELLAFYEMVLRLRGQYKHNDRTTNVGHVVAAEFNNRYPSGTSIKLLVHPAMECMTDGGATSERGQIDGYGAPVAFTCDIGTTVEHVIMHVFCELEGQVLGSVTDYSLKPIGLTEWLSTTSKLSQLECVHNSLKLDLDVQLGLCPRNANTMDVIARTLQDDLRDAELKPEDVVAHEPVVETINFDNLMILLETLEDEISKFETAVADAARHTVISCSGIVQAVKMVCALLGAIDTLDVTAAIADLQQKSRDSQTVIAYRDVGGTVSSSGNSGVKLDIVSEQGVYAEVNLRPKTVSEAIRRSCDKIRDAVQTLLQTYSHAFRVDFHVLSALDYGAAEQPLAISYVSQPVMVRLQCVHRPPAAWTPTYDDYMLGAQIYHGTRYIGDAQVVQCSAEITGLFPRLTIDSWLKFEHIPVCTLPRESRLIFVLYGCTAEQLEGGATASEGSSDGTGVAGGQSSSTQTTGSTVAIDQKTTNGTHHQHQRRITKVELGWTAIQFFEFERRMIRGTYLLSLWPPTTDKFLGPAPAKGTHPRGYHCPVLSIEIPPYGGSVVFPEATEQKTESPRLDFASLDRNLQQELIDTAELGYPSGAVDKREVLWEKRYYLHTALPHALPKVLHAAHSWDFASLVDLHALVRSWQPLGPLQALELLLPRYPDMEVRAHAIRWIAVMRSDQLVDFLPQLLQALKHDTYEASPMAEFLLRRALESPRVAHHLYWQLVHSLPGDSPHNSAVQGSSGGSAGGGSGCGGSAGTSTQMDGISGGMAGAGAAAADAYITQARYTRRNRMMLRALLAICGERLATRLLGQDMMCKALGDCALSVQQQSKDSARAKALMHGLACVEQVLNGRPTALPLAPGAEVAGVNARASGYFNSNTLPLRVCFAGPDGRTVAAIFKAGDDLQQDQLTIQLVRIMDKLWLEEGLDLKMVTFNCVPTGRKKGMIEMVGEAETLRKIQVEWGLTGSFKDKPIAEWLARQNPSQLEYQRAVENFTVSCAGYSVATYILGICDRHNDNIMLKTSGHLFHIDFGKFLGDAQMFGNFKRDRTPFVLTSDMAYVINGGDRPSTQFHHFVDLCCQAFNIVRKHGDLILHMVALMATSGIPGVTADAVTYVRKALLPGQSNPEAAAAFAKMIHISLKSWFTQFNFFLHNLAQLRFTGDEGNGELLSFVPRTYTMSQDGRLKSVTVHGFQKRYDLEKYYTFILKVTRQSQPDPAYLFRSYKEFSEFHQKLCMHYPLAKLHSLPSGIHVGRSNIKTVAERRLPEIRHFLVSLFNSADEIAHSDVVYTFFHPLLRDQQEQDIHVAKVKDNNKPATPKERVCGEIKLSLQYHRGALTVMIHHARSLPATTSGQEPNTYVKTYLKPDPTKVTKRKTKVVRKNCFPSYMETLEYRMPIESIQNRVLQVTVWSHDSLQENEFLGGVDMPFAGLDLTQEVMNWFPLRYLSRS